MLKNGSPAKLTLVDRIDCWMSTARNIDGLWVGAFTNQNETALRRVEDALQLMKRQSPLHYSRVVRGLDRIWVNLTPGAFGSYSRRLNACQLDERFVLDDKTTPELIASVIVHEGTHARLERRGVAYEEAKRPRIEAICLRRELNFVSGLPGCENLQQGLRASLDYYADHPEFFSNGNMNQRFLDESLESLRWLGAPNWLLAVLSKLTNARRRRAAASH